MNLLGSIAKGVQKIAAGIAKKAKQTAQKVKSTASKVKNKIKRKKPKEKPREEPTQEPQEEPTQEPTQEPSEEQEQQFDYSQTIISNFISMMRQIADDVISERESRREHVEYWYAKLLIFIQNQEPDALADCIEENAGELIRYIERCFWASDQQAKEYYNIVVIIIRNHIEGARTLISESVQDTQDFYFNEDI